MWNNFDYSKTKIEKCFESEPVASGMEKWTLINNTLDLFKSEDTFSAQKVKAVSFVLENASLDEQPDNIFAFRINHATVMSRVLNEQMAKYYSLCLDEEKTRLRDSFALRSTMDFSHIAPDWKYLLQKGIPGVIEDLSSYNDTNGYYAERIAVYKSVINYFLRYAKIYENLGTEKGRFVADNFYTLATSAPKTMAQAMQLMLCVHTISTYVDTVVVRSLGGLDRLLYPYYINDLKSGSFTKEQLDEIIKYFFFNISCYKVLANMPFYISGTDDDGNDVTNELTFKLLENYRELDIYDPKFHIMYHDKIDKKVVDTVLSMIREGKNSFVFVNTEVIRESLEKIGVSAEDAKRIIIYGCYEPAAEATEVPSTCAGFVNFPKALEFALNNGFDVMKNLETSIKTGEDFKDFDSLYNATLKQLEYLTLTCMENISSFEKHYHNVCPSFILSPTYKDSRESGIDIYSGGAKYNNTSIVGVGIATLVDSLMVIKKMVFEDKEITLDYLKKVLISNWELDPKLKYKVKGRCSKFGNNDTEADGIATEIYDKFAALINNKPNGRKGIFRMGMFSVDWRYFLGKWTAASADGRINGEALSKNTSASVGQDKNGVTAYLNTLLKFDATECSDGYVADVTMHYSAVKDDDGMDAFKGLLNTFMKKGGHSVHFNVLSPETLIKAQTEPDKYKNLQIRLCGWNVRFVDLDKEQQDEFIIQSSNIM